MARRSCYHKDAMFSNCPANNTKCSVPNTGHLQIDSGAFVFNPNIYSTCTEAAGSCSRIHSPQAFFVTPLSSCQPVFPPLSDSGKGSHIPKFATERSPKSALHSVPPKCDCATTRTNISALPRDGPLSCDIEQYLTSNIRSSIDELKTPLTRSRSYSDPGLKIGGIENAPNEDFIADSDIKSTSSHQVPHQQDHLNEFFEGQKRIMTQLLQDLSDERKLNRQLMRELHVARLQLQQLRPVQLNTHDTGYVPGSITELVQQLQMHRSDDLTYGTPLSRSAEKEPWLGGLSAQKMMNPEPYTMNCHPASKSHATSRPMSEQGPTFINTASTLDVPDGMAAELRLLRSLQESLSQPSSLETSPTIQVGDDVTFRSLLETERVARLQEQARVDKLERLVLVLRKKLAGTSASTPEDDPPTPPSGGQQPTPPSTPSSLSEGGVTLSRPNTGQLTQLLLQGPTTEL